MIKLNQALAFHLSSVKGTLSKASSVKAKKIKSMQI